MKFIIRRAQHQDAAGIFEAHMGSIRQVCCKDYTSEQIKAWSGRKFRADLWCQSMDRDFVWVVESDGKIFGFAHFGIMSEEVGEILGLYFLPEAMGKGLGKTIIKTIVELAREKDLKKIILSASLTAKSFYQSVGFYQCASDDTVEIGGVPIDYHPMEMVLQTTAASKNNH